MHMILLTIAFHPSKLAARQIALIQPQRTNPPYSSVIRHIGTATYSWTALRLHSVHEHALAAVSFSPIYVSQPS